MKTYVFPAILWLVATIALAAPALAYNPPPCSGNACGEVTANFQNGCHMVTNTGPNRVHVRWGVFSNELNSGGIMTIRNLDGRCLPYFAGGTLQATRR